MNKLCNFSSILKEKPINYGGFLFVVCLFHLLKILIIINGFLCFWLKPNHMCVN